MTTLHRTQLAQLPLAEIAANVASLVGKMSLDEVAALLGRGALTAPQPQAPRAASTGASGPIADLDQIAAAVLALPNARQRLREVERAVVTRALAVTKGNVSAAARLLGTERKALERRIERYKIAVRRGR